MRTSIPLFASFVILIHANVPSGAEQASGAINTSSPASTSKTCRESFSRNSTEEFNKKCIALAGPLAAMRGDTLVLRLDNGRRKIFDNKNGSGADVGAFGYGLADFYPSMHIFVVADHGPDDSHFISIDGRTGRELDFGYASPHFSPDGNLVLAVTYSNDDEIDTEFAILDIRGNKQLTVWTSKASKTPLPAKAKFVAWTDSQTITFTSPGQKLLSLTPTADGAWNVVTAPN